MKDSRGNRADGKDMYDWAGGERGLNLPNISPSVSLIIIIGGADWFS
jgi:hypothetical protein